MISLHNHIITFFVFKKNRTRYIFKLETVSIAEPLQNRQHVQNP